MRKPFNDHFILLPVFLISFFGLYYLSQFCFFQTSYQLRDTWIDRQIPFVGWTIIIYLSHYPLLLVVWYINLDEKPINFYMPFFLCSAITFIIFFFFPTTIERPDIYPGIWQKIYSILYTLDKPVNCLPSLHVSLALLAGLSLRKQGLVKKIFIWIWVFFVSFSTLTTKQHLFIDVLGGMLISCFVFTFLMFLKKMKKMSRASRIVLK